MLSRSGLLLASLAALAVLAYGGPCRAQTVIRDSALPPPDSIRLTPNQPIRPNYDTSTWVPRRDTTPKPAAKPQAKPEAAPAPAPSPPPPDPYPKGVCTEDVPPSGGDAPDILMVTFASRTQRADREAALKTVNGTLVAPDLDDPRIWYVRVASDGNEFVLRSIADRLIRARSVSEVGPVHCPPRQ
jgi:hypothetical protein